MVSRCTDAEYLPSNLPPQSVSVSPQFVFLVEYQTFPSMEWHPAKYEESVILQLLKDQFLTFVNKVKTTDCQAELRRLLSKGPPIYISDSHALPIPEGDTHIGTLWFSSDNTERAAKLEGALEGEERQKLWDELNQFIIEEGQEEGDLDDANKDQS